MAAWGHPGMAALPAEITEEKLQEKGKYVWHIPTVEEFCVNGM